MDIYLTVLKRIIQVLYKLCKRHCKVNKWNTNAYNIDMHTINVGKLYRISLFLIREARNVLIIKFLKHITNHAEIGLH